MVTANHVVQDWGTRTGTDVIDGETDRASRRVTFTTREGDVLPVERVERDVVLDVAVLHLAKPAPEALVVAQAVEGMGWRGEAQPSGNDPLLTGTIDATDWRLVNRQGHKVNVLQLRVDQQLGEYGGYSGSPVGLQSPRGTVVGLLVEQLPLRLGRPGQSPAASNVLYAIPIQTVVERFNLGGVAAVTRPARISAPPPPVDAVERAKPLGRLLEAVIAAATVAKNSSTPATVVMAFGLPGMGKTVLAQQIAHHARVWQTFPGGVLWTEAGEHADPDDLIRQLTADPQLRTLDTLVGPPVLIVVDDVWAESVLRRVRDALPSTVTVLATTRGILLDGAVMRRVDQLTRDEAVGLLARAIRRTTEVEAVLVELAAVLGFWPLLVDMAGRYLHLVDLPIDDIDADLGMTTAADRLQADTVAEAITPDEFIERARRLRDEFLQDPTVLDVDDPGGQESHQRSLTRMVERSLRTLNAQDAHGFAELAAYPPDAALTPTLLSDLWSLTGVRTQQRMVRLGRVGLATVRRQPLNLRLHDLLVAWLHQRYGSPDHPAHHHLHQRCAHAAMTLDGETSALTGDQAGWLAFHLCRSGRVDDPARLLASGWREAYRAATGADATYLDALRAILRHFGSLPHHAVVASGVEAVSLEGWMLQAELLQAYISAQVDITPVNVLVVRAFLGQLGPALRQAAQYPEPWSAARAIVEIVTALGDQGRLRLQAAANLAADLAAGLSGDEQSWTLAGIAGVVTSSDRLRAVQLADQAERLATTLPDEWQRSQALAETAPVMAGYDPDRAERLAIAVPDLGQRSETLAMVALVVASHDPDRAAALSDQAKQLATGLPDEHWRSELWRSLVLAAVALVVDSHDPARAAALADQIEQLATALPNERLRTWVLAGIARAVASYDSDRAEQLVATLPDEGEHSSVLAAVAGAVVGYDPRRVELPVEELGVAEPDYEQRRSALAAVAVMVGGRDPSRADAPAVRMERVASALPDEGQRSWVLAAVAKAVASRDPDRADALADQAEQLAAALPQGRRRSSVLATVAGALAGYDPDRAARLAAASPDDSWRSWMFAEVARAVASRDPDRALALADQAERLAASLPDEGQRSWVLASVARQVASYDSGRGAALADRAERLAAANPDVSWRSGAVAEVAQAVATYDPDRAAALADQAEQFATTLPKGAQRNGALIDVARAVASFDPDRAIRLAATISNKFQRSYVLAHVAGVVASSEPERAVALADQVERLAATFPRKDRMWGLAEIAPAVAGRDPDRAAALADQAERLAATLPNEGGERDVGLSTLASLAASYDPDRAERLAAALSSEWERAEALAPVIRKIVSYDPARAERLAASFLDMHPDVAYRTNFGGLIAGMQTDRHRRSYLMMVLTTRWSHLATSLGLLTDFLEARAHNATTDEMLLLVRSTSDILTRMEAMLEIAARGEDDSAGGAVPASGR